MDNNSKVIEQSEKFEVPQQPEHQETPPTPAPQNPKTPRNQHLKAENPKNHQLTGRATEQEAFFIKKAIAARKKQLGLTENEPYDSVRLLLDLIKKNNNDFLSSIKTR